MKNTFHIVLPIFTISLLSGCTASRHKVIWLNNDGYLISENALLIGEHPVHNNPTSAFDNPEGYHYEFLNWKDQNGVFYTNDYVVGNSDVIFTAQYELKSNKCSVTWKNDDGSILKTDNEVFYNSHPLCDLSEPKSTKLPSKGYSFKFDGWIDSNGKKYDTNYLVGESDVTFTATYSEIINSFKVTWMNDDGTLIDETECEYHKHPVHEIPTSATTPKTGYHFEFVNWESSTQEEYSEDFVMPNHDITLTAKYNEIVNSHSIRWINDDGLLINETKCNYGEHPEGETPTSTKTPVTGYHFEFKGWIGSNGEKYSDDFVMPDYDLIFSATYNESINTFKVTWKDMFGDLIDITDVDYNSNPKHADPKKEDNLKESKEYYFEGWYLNDEKIDINEYKVTKDVTIVAKYNTFNIGGCVYELNNDKKSYRVVGTQSGYPSASYTVLDVYKEIPVTNIGEDAFRRCEHKNIKVVIGKNVEEIGIYAFAYVSFSSVEFAAESNLKIIGLGAFFGAENLGTIKVPGSLEQIGDNAFLSATSFYVLDLSELDHVVSITDRSFDKTTCEFLVKDEEMLQQYKTAWPNLESRISIKTDN